MASLFTLVVVLAVGVGGPQTILGAEPPAGGLRVTEPPALLPIDAKEPAAPTTLRVLAEESPDPSLPPRSELRLFTGGAAAETPPGGRWCFAGDASSPETRPPHSEGHTVDHPPEAVSATSYDAAGDQPYDISRILSILDEQPVELAQTRPGIPRVLPPPQDALPPDTGYPGAHDPLEVEPRPVAPRLPERRPSDEVESSQAFPYCPAVSPSIPTPSPEASQYYPEDFEAPTEDIAIPLDQPCPCHRNRCGGESPADGREPKRLLTPSCFACRDITLGGWLDQGITAAANHPVDRFNGPVTFNDRAGEYQMNQLYLFLDRPIQTDGCGWDLGGRIDVLYGTDAPFAQSLDGLEESWNQQDRFYQLALPQFYVEVGFDDWTMRTGHFYKIMGYEEIGAPYNFFYSHSYAFEYGEPVTDTGMLFTYDGMSPFELLGGFSRGIDQFNDTDGADHLCFLGGIHWTSPDGRREVRFDVNGGEQGPGNSTMVYSLVGELQLTDRLRWVLEHNYGQSTGGNPRGIRKAEWYGLSQYVLYQMSRTWGVGARIEWFCDEEGTLVRGIREGNLATGPYAGSFYDLTLGLNWQPRPNVTLRPEVRWDWFHGESLGPNKPYDGGQRNEQFLYGFDLIVEW